MTRLLSWRFSIGLIVGVAITVIPRLIGRSNIFITLIGLLLTSELAHAITPRTNALLAMAIGFVFGIFLGIDVYQNDLTPGQVPALLGYLANAFLWAVLVALIFAALGFVIGKIFGPFRERKGFFF